MAGNIKWTRPASIGPHFVICILLGYWMGSNLDRWFDTKPILTAVFCVFGCIAGFINLYKEVQALNNPKDEAGDDE